MLAVCLLLGICTGCSCNSTDKSGEEDIAANRLVCGGYTDFRTPTDEELEMFASLTKEEETEFHPELVATQVVAGINYKFLCLSKSPDGNTGHCYVTVYKPLPGQGEPKVTGLEVCK